MGPRVEDGVESALWQDLADALNKLHEWGLMPVYPPRPIDAGDVIHGGGVRGPGEGYLLRFVPPGSEESDRRGGHGWTVFPRSDTDGVQNGGAA
jgi:hypothetical protein